VTVLATLTCAGNRRKEENMVKKTIGFSWGPGGTACSYWTGVRMSHLLRLAGVDQEREVIIFLSLPPLFGKYKGPFACSTCFGWQG
jgi:DMSO/TMAO reductase YedYZ molybdopterin-dependent catalytic subunit